ncbi:MAG: hypothetical protein GEU75_15325 [Dehalococcoidia bacterium]|nr:hypothetical protein [Dehalococcoidia bacterium]
MKVYAGHRIRTLDNPSRGEPFVGVHDVLGRPPTSVDDLVTCECRNLTVVTYHSPTGIEWGYAGSGPADLALSILADYFGETPQQVQVALRSLWSARSKAAALHQRFKEDFLAQERRDEWQIRADVIDAWLASPSNRTCLERLAEQDAELARIRELDEEERGASD